MTTTNTTTNTTTQERSISITIKLKVYNPERYEDYNYKIFIEKNKNGVDVYRRYETNNCDHCLDMYEYKNIKEAINSIKESFIFRFTSQGSVTLRYYVNIISGNKVYSKYFKRSYK